MQPAGQVGGVRQLHHRGAAGRERLVGGQRALRGDDGQALASQAADAVDLRDALHAAHLSALTDIQRARGGRCQRHCRPALAVQLAGVVDVADALTLRSAVGSPRAQRSAGRHTSRQLRVSANCGAVGVVLVVVRVGADGAALERPRGDDRRLARVHLVAVHGGRQRRLRAVRQRAGHSHTLARQLTRPPHLRDALHATHLARLAHYERAGGGGVHRHGRARQVGAVHLHDGRAGRRAERLAGGQWALRRRDGDALASQAADAVDLRDAFHATDLSALTDVQRTGGGRCQRHCCSAFAVQLAGVVDVADALALRGAVQLGAVRGTSAQCGAGGNASRQLRVLHPLAANGRPHAVEAGGRALAAALLPVRGLRLLAAGRGVGRRQRGMDGVQVSDRIGVGARRYRLCRVRVECQVDGRRGGGRVDAGGGHVQVERLPRRCANWHCRRLCRRCLRLLPGRPGGRRTRHTTDGRCGAERCHVACARLGGRIDRLHNLSGTGSRSGRHHRLRVGRRGGSGALAHHWLRHDRRGGDSGGCGGCGGEWTDWRDEWSGVGVAGDERRTAAALDGHVVLAGGVGLHGCGRRERSGKRRRGLNIAGEVGSE